MLFALAQFPGVVASAADLRHPHRVARYLEELAGTYHRFRDACRILPRDGQPASPVNRARLWVAEATRIVLANGLQLLGVSAPDRLLPEPQRGGRPSHGNTPRKITIYTPRRRTLTHGTLRHWVSVPPVAGF